MVVPESLIGFACHLPFVIDGAGIRGAKAVRRAEFPQTPCRPKEGLIVGNPDRLPFLIDRFGLT